MIVLSPLSVSKAHPKMTLSPEGLQHVLIQTPVLPVFLGCLITWNSSACHSFFLLNREFNSFYSKHEILGSLKMEGGERSVNATGIPSNLKSHPALPAVASSDFPLPISYPEQISSMLPSSFPSSVPPPASKFSSLLSEKVSSSQQPGLSNLLDSKNDSRTQQKCSSSFQQNPASEVAICGVSKAPLLPSPIYCSCTCYLPLRVFSLLGIKPNKDVYKVPKGHQERNLHPKGFCIHLCIFNCSKNPAKSV